MQAEDVLHLMSTAPERHETVRAALVYRGDGPKIKTLRERYARSEAGRRTFGDSPEGIWHPEPDSAFGWRCKVWRVDERRWRQELELPDGGTSTVVSTGRIRPLGTPEGPPGSSERWELRTDGSSREENPSWIIHPADVFWTMYPFDPAGFVGIDGELARLDLTVGTPSGASCSASPHGWRARISTPWRWRRCTSTSRWTRRSSPRANL